MGSIANQEIQNVAVAGANGLIGSKLIGFLLESGRFNVTILGRTGFSPIPSGARLAIVDYEDQESLISALQGQDAVASTLSREATRLQIPLIDAAVAAGVKRFIPSEFGGNLQDPNVRKLPNYMAKVEVEEYLEKQSKAHGITYTYIYNNVLLDWSLEMGVLLNLKEGSVRLYNGGQRAVSMIRVPVVAKAVVQVLLLPEETKNRAVRVHEIVISQGQILAYAKEVGPKREWREEHVDLAELEAKLKREHKSSLPNLSLFHTYAVKGAFSDGFGNQFDEDDNKLLGIQPLGADGMKQLLVDIAEKLAQGQP